MFINIVHYQNRIIIHRTNMELFFTSIASLLPSKSSTSTLIKSVSISKRTQNRLIYSLVGLGVFFRLFHFFNNRSFFIDELFLSVNLIKMNYWQLATLPFEYEQKAPLGYLWVSRTFVLLLGNHEQALRLFSLLCGLAALFLFVPVARYFLKSWGAVVAVGILALSTAAVYHSVEAKQYSVELLATVLCLYWYIHYKDAATFKSLVIWGVLGGALVWFAFPTIFVLAGICAAICLPAAMQRDWLRVALCLIPCTIWLVSFGLQYHFFISKYHDSGWLTDFFKVRYDAYLPIMQPLAAIKWLGTKFYLFLVHPLGLLVNTNDESNNNLNHLGLRHISKLSWLFRLLIVLGAYFLFRKNKWYFLVLFTPVALALLASSASQYPFHERFMLFLAPPIILALAYGGQQLVTRIFPNRRVAYLAVGILLVSSLINSVQQVVNRDAFYNRAYYRDVALFINDRFREGDAVYVYWNMRQGYEYYKAAYNLKYNAVEGSFVKNQSRNQVDYLQHLQPDFASFKGKKRLWIIYDTAFRDPIGDYVDVPAWYYSKAFPPGRVLNDYFSTLGKNTRVYHKGNFAINLVEFN